MFRNYHQIKRLDFVEIYFLVRHINSQISREIVCFFLIAGDKRECHILCFLEKGRILLSRVPEKVNIEKQEDIAHDRPSCQESTIEKGMETDNIGCDRQDHESCECFSVRPEKDDREKCCDSDTPGDIATHKDFDKTKCSVSVIELTRWCRKNAKCS